MGRVRCEYNWHNTGRQVFFDGSTFETLWTGFPVQFIEDFLGAAVEPFDGTINWNVIDVSAAGTGTTAIVADSSNGQFRLAHDAQDEAQDMVLYQNDNKTFDVGNGLIFETRVNMAVSAGAGVVAVFGMCGDHNLDKDSVTEHAWFRLQASDSILCETDDTTNDNDDEDTGLDVTNGTFNIFRIDFTTLADVKFFIDGVRVCSSTTFDMSNLTAGEQQMQPYFSLDKASGAGLGTMDIDYIKIFSNRN